MILCIFRFQIHGILWTRSYKKFNDSLYWEFRYVKFVTSRFNCSGEKRNRKIRPKLCCTAGESCQMVTLNVGAKPHISCCALKYNCEWCYGGGLGNESNDLVLSYGFNSCLHFSSSCDLEAFSLHHWATLFLIQFKFIGDTYKSHVEGLSGEKAVCLHLKQRWCPLLAITQAWHHSSLWRKSKKNSKWKELLHNTTPCHSSTWALYKEHIATKIQGSVHSLLAGCWFRCFLSASTVLFQFALQDCSWGTCIIHTILHQSSAQVTHARCDAQCCQACL